MSSCLPIVRTESGHGAVLCVPEMGLSFLDLYSHFHFSPEEILFGFGWGGGLGFWGGVRQITPPPPRMGEGRERAHKTLAVRTIGGHWLKQWTVGGEGRGEQARLEPNADIATGPIAAPSHG